MSNQTGNWSAANTMTGMAANIPIMIGTHFNPLRYNTKKLATKVSIMAATEMKSVTKPITSFLGNEYRKSR